MSDLQCKILHFLADVLPKGRTIGELMDTAGQVETMVLDLWELPEIDLTDTVEADDIKRMRSAAVEETATGTFKKPTGTGLIVTSKDRVKQLKVSSSIPKKADRSMNGTPWTDEDEETLIRMRSEGRKYREIGTALNRTIPAIQNKIDKMNRKTTKKKSPIRKHKPRRSKAVRTIVDKIGKKRPAIAPWDERDNGALMEMKGDGKTYAEIGDFLGRTSSSCQSQFQNIKTRQKKMVDDAKHPPPQKSVVLSDREQMKAQGLID
jgi:DNA-binding CsgD family transcriptional regulator